MDEFSFLGMGCAMIIIYILATIAIVAGTLWACIWVLQQTGIIG